MGLIQPIENGHDSFRFARVPGVRQGDDLACTRFTDQQHAAGRKRQHARTIHLREDRNMEALGKFQSLQVEGSLLGTAKERKQKWEERSGATSHVYLMIANG
jgi:hypothetical protein